MLKVKLSELTESRNSSTADAVTLTVTSRQRSRGISSAISRVAFWSMLIPAESVTAHRTQ